MCLCNGTGTVINDYGSYKTVDPCPDSNCTFDRKEADRAYEEWKRKGMEFYGAKAV